MERQNCLMIHFFITLGGYIIIFSTYVIILIIYSLQSQKADCDQTSMFQRTTHFFAAYNCIKKVCFEKQCRLLF